MCRAIPEIAFKLFLANLEYILDTVLNLAAQVGLQPLHLLLLKIDDRVRRLLLELTEQNQVEVSELVTLLKQIARMRNIDHFCHFDEFPEGLNGETLQVHVVSQNCMGL